MATCKTGLLYYNVDTDRFQDIRIKRLKKDLGCDGYAVYQYILNEIYRVRGCFLVWDESTAFDAAEYWGLKETKVNEIVRYCCHVGLFNKELLSNGRVLTSSSIQSRYVNMCIRSKRKEIVIPEQYDILPEESRIILEEYLKGQRTRSTDKGTVLPEQCDILPEESRILPEQCDIIPVVCRKVKKNIKKYSTDVESKESRFSPSTYSLTLNEEISTLKGECIWLNNLQVLHHMDVERLKEKLDEFGLHCAADGLERHNSLADAKQHFNNWLRIVAAKQDKNAENRQESRNRRRGNLLRADEEKDYSGSF